MQKGDPTRMDKEGIYFYDRQHHHSCNENMQFDSKLTQIERMVRE
jgi:hypothetical protein